MPSCARIHARCIGTYVARREEDGITSFLPCQPRQSNPAARMRIIAPIRFNAAASRCSPHRHAPPPTAEASPPPASSSSSSSSSPPVAQAFLYGPGGDMTVSPGQKRRCSGAEAQRLRVGVRRTAASWAAPRPCRRDIRRLEQQRPRRGALGTRARHLVHESALSVSSGPPAAWPPGSPVCSAREPKRRVSGYECTPRVSQPATSASLRQDGVRLRLQHAHWSGARWGAQPCVQLLNAEKGYAAGMRPFEKASRGRAAPRPPRWLRQAGG